MKNVAAILVVLAMVSVASAEITLDVAPTVEGDMTKVVMTFTNTAEGGLIAAFDGGVFAANSQLNQVFGFGGMAPTPTNPYDVFGTLYTADPMDTHFNVAPASLIVVNAATEQLAGDSLTGTAGLIPSVQMSSMDLIQAVFDSTGAVGDLVVSDTPLAGPSIYLDIEIASETGAKEFFNSYIGYVPEPATMSLLGLGGLALIRRRR